MAQIRRIKFELCHLFLKFTVLVVTVQGAERSGLFQGISNFNGLAEDTTVTHKGLCSARYLLYMNFIYGCLRHEVVIDIFQKIVSIYVRTVSHIRIKVHFLATF